MKILLSEIALLFEKMQEEINIAAVSVVVFTGQDVDALCALKLLCVGVPTQTLFKTENIHYKAYPVSTYSSLRVRVEEAKEFEEVRVFCFINCGALIDLTEFWFLTKAKVFLFDSARPVYHANLESPDIHVVNDGHSAFEHCPAAEELARFQELNESELGDDSDESEEDDQSKDGRRVNKRLYREKMKKHRDLLGQKIHKYYESNFYGLPSSYLVYRLLRELHKISNEELWVGIVGATACYLEQRLTREQFDLVNSFYRSEVPRFNPATEHPQKGQITPQRGFQLVFLEHWSLYDSLLSSPYSITYLHLWSDRAAANLNRYIASLGVSLKDAQQLFRCISKDSQQKLEASLFSSAEHFHLHEIAFLSFVRQTDYADSFSASDYAYILLAALESPPGTKMTLEELLAHQSEMFWQAYDLFHARKSELEAYIEKFKTASKLSTRIARSLIERELVVTMKQVSYTSICCDNDDYRGLEHPAVLARLARLMMGIQSQRSRASRAGSTVARALIRHPFIISLTNSERKVSMLVGVHFDFKNSLGLRFNEVALKLKQAVRQDHFENTVIILPMEQVIDFIRELSCL